MGRVLPIVFVFLWALYGIAQYGPGEGGYGAVSLQFSGRLVSAGSCVQEAANLIRCRVPAGTQGTIQLTATVTPGSYPVSIAAVSLTSWARFRPASGYGTAQATCTFLPPAGAARSTFELRFRASTTGAYVDLVVILEVIAPPAEYRTDGQGGFSVPAEELPDTWITGALTRCGDGPLADTPVTVRLIPVEGKASIRGLSDIGAVEISSPGYGTATVPRERLRFLSSMDISGHVQRTIDVGTVCLGVGEAPYTPPITPGAVYGETGANGELSISLDPKTRVSGRLKECGGGTPLAGVAVRLTPMYERGKLVGFEIVPEGYPPRAVTEILRLSLFNVTIYNLGEVCFGPPIGEVGCRKVSLKVLSLNAQRLTANAKAVAAREQEIMNFIKKGGSYQFDIVCLQEWFQDVDVAGITGVRAWSTDKGPLIRHWIGARPNLEEVKVGGQEVRGIRLINAYPNSYGAEIIFGSNYVAGPDCTRFLETRIDGGLVILVKPPYKIIAASAFLFSSGEDWDAHASKGALYARVQLDPDNSDCYIHVFNTHLQADYPGKSYAGIRKAQIDELIEFIGKCTADDQDGHPVVLTGDFNIAAPRPGDWGKGLVPPEGSDVDTRKPTESNEYAFLERWLRALGLRDAWTVLRRNDPGFTWIGKDWRTRFPSPWGNLGNTLATEGGWPARLDYIFVFSGRDNSPITLRLVEIQRSPESTSPKTKPYRWRHGGQWVNSFALSDHLGLILEVVAE